MLLSLDEKSKLVELAWQDSKPFQEIEFQFGLTEGQVTQLMNKYLNSNSYKRWCEQVSNLTNSHH